MAQLSVSKFSNELQKQLFPDNDFYKKSIVDGGIAPNVETVYLPIAGDVAAAGSGNPSLPLAVTERTDDQTSYAVTQVYAGPILVKREEEIVLSYNKMRDVSNAMANTINSKVASIAAYGWADINTVVPTTGSGRAASITGATGNRKAIAKADLISLRKVFLKMNLGNLAGKLYLLVNADMYGDLLGIDEFVNFEKLGVVSKLQEGIVGRLAGFEIMVRNDSLNSVGVLSNVGNTAKKAITESVVTTDNAVGLAWHSDYVRHAEGNAATFIDRGKPEYLGGTIMSSVVRFGATMNRTDHKGTALLCEVAA